MGLLRLFASVCLLVGFASSAWASCEAELTEGTRYSSTWKVGETSVVVPSIGQGYRFWTSLPSGKTTQELTQALRTEFGPQVELVPLQAEAPAELSWIETHPDVQLLEIRGLVPSSMEGKLNRSVGFSGPNCYAVAFAAAGVDLSPGSMIWGMRHVSSEEFEEILAKDFEKVSEPKRGDLIVYEAHGDRGHAAIYLGGGLVLQKKGPDNGYQIRVTGIDAVSKPEPYEWAPRRDREVRTLDGMLTNDRMYYRRKPDQVIPITRPLEVREKKFVELVDYFLKVSSDAADRWKVGQELGVVYENLLSEIANQQLEFKASPRGEVRMAYARLLSARDQINKSISSAHFSSPSAEMRKRKIYEQICYQDGPLLRESLKKVLDFFARSSTTEAVESAVSKLRTINRQECDNAQILKLILP